MHRGRDNAGPPPFLRLVGEELRWGLLGELARSDRRVSELTSLLGQPQSLVSYHLRQLRSGGLVASRRSSADGRDTYYHLDLARCAASLAAAGHALHPGLRLAPAPAAPTAVAGTRVLFLCTGNSARSQLAEAMLRRAAPGIVAASAGSQPKPLHPNAVAVAGEYGLSLAGCRPKHLDEFAGRRFDYVISLCDRVREVCPEFPGRPDLVHWSLPDPAAAGPTDASSYPAFQRTGAELSTRIGYLLHRIATRPQEGVPTT